MSVGGEMEHEVDRALRKTMGENVFMCVCPCVFMYCMCEEKITNKQHLHNVVTKPAISYLDNPQLRSKSLR